MNELAGLAQDVKLYKSIQKMRLGLGERIRSTLQGRSDLDLGRYEGWYDGLFAIEKNVRKTVEQIAGQHLLWTEWLCHVRGVGKLGLGQLLGEIGVVNATHNRIIASEPKAQEEKNDKAKWIAERGDQPKAMGIGAFDTVSSLWHFAGLVPGLKRVKGERASYNTRLKTICLEHIGGSIIRANGAYRRVYDDRKTLTTATRDLKEWPPLRLHYDARRVMVKMFLSHFWEKWRLLEGYPIRLPYVIERLGHTNLYRAEEFLEPAAERDPEE